MRFLFHIFLLALLLPSCFQEEEIVPPHEQGDLEEGQVGLGTTYERQVYYDLLANIEEESHLISAYDLSFESSTGGWIIRLNSAKFMLAGNSMDTVFSKDLNASDLDMIFDKSDGNPDSTAIGPWFELGDESAESFRYIYLIDRGKNENNKPMGLRKVQFDISGDDYIMRYSNTDNSHDTVVIISKIQTWTRSTFPLILDLRR